MTPEQIFPDVVDRETGMIVELCVQGLHDPAYRHQRLFVEETRVDLLLPGSDMFQRKIVMTGWTGCARVPRLGALVGVTLDLTLVRCRATQRASFCFGTIWPQ